MSGPEKERNGFTPRIDLTINPTTIVAAVGLIVWFVTGAGRTEQNQRDITAIQTIVAGMASSKQLDAVETKLTAQMRDINMTVMSLPDQRARLDQVERRLQENTQHNGEQDARIGAVERMAIQATSDLDNFKRGNSVQIPGTRGPR